MSQFTYEARDQRGEFTAGIINAASLDEAGRLLSGRGQYVIKLAAATDDDQSQTRFTSGLFGRRVRRREVMWFISQLAVMVEAGVPLSEALECLGRQSLNPPFQRVVDDVVQSVQEGRPLSDAMEMHPGAFPNIVTSLVRASEMSGTMSLILQRVADYLVKQEQIRKRVRGALMYPGVMFAVCIGVMVFLLTAIMPKFEKIFNDQGAALPFTTRLLLDGSDLFMRYWPIWVGALVLLVGGIALGRRTQWGRRRWDGGVIRIPLIGGLLVKAYQGQAFHTMSTLLHAGVPLMDAIEMTRQGSTNVHFNDLWGEVAANVRHGKQLSGPLFNTALIAEPVAQMIDSGERSARLSQVFERVGRIIEEEYAEASRNLTQLIEPVMIIVMGSFVGFVAISLMLPMFNAANVVSGQ